MPAAKVETLPHLGNLSHGPALALRTWDEDELRAHAARAAHRAQTQHSNGLYYLAEWFWAQWANCRAKLQRRGVEA